MRTWFLIAMSIVTLGEEVWAQSGAGAATWRPVVMGKNGMVAAEYPLQALAGLRVLQNGGNAVDAAVAVFYMTAVTEPSEAGLGGDGLLLAYIKSLDVSGSRCGRIARNYLHNPARTDHPRRAPNMVMRWSCAIFSLRIFRHALKASPARASPFFTSVRDQILPIS